MTDQSHPEQAAPVGSRPADERDFDALGLTGDGKISEAQEAILHEVDAALERIATGIATEKKALDALIERIFRRTK